MASVYTLMVTVCAIVSVTGIPHFTLSTEKSSWPEAESACARNGSSLATPFESNTEIDGLLKNASDSDVWTSQRTFLSGWVANQGCHTGDLSDIPGKQVTPPKVGQCQQYCEKNGSEYFTLQDSTCRCINITNRALNRTPDSDCNVTCGEGQEAGTKCGGQQQNVFSLYKILRFARQGKQQIICETHPGRVVCPSLTVINVTYANYGLTKRIESCPKDILPIYSLNCSHQNSTAVIKNLCNYKQTCNITPTNDFFGGDPCSGTTKLLNISYTCIPKDSADDLCRVFRFDSNGTINLKSVPCNSTVESAACSIYNESLEEDTLKIYMHNGTWTNAVSVLCNDGFIPPINNITKQELMHANKNRSGWIWSGYFRQRIDVDDIDRDLEGKDLVQCYAWKNSSKLVRLNCTEKRHYICQKDIVADEQTTQAIISTVNTSGGNGGSSSNDEITTVKTVMTTRVTTTTTQKTYKRPGLAKPRDSSREDTKIIGIGAGIAGGSIVFLAVTAVVVDRLCKRSGKRERQKKKKKKTKEQRVEFKGGVINAQNALDSVHSDTSSDESDNGHEMTNRTSSTGEAEAKPSGSNNYSIVNETGSVEGHENDAYAYAVTNSADSEEEAAYDAMGLCVDDDDDEHIYSHTMLPLPDMGENITDVVPQESNSETYDVMQTKVKNSENDSAYDHTTGFSKNNGTVKDGEYNVFNEKVKDTAKDTYDYTQSVSGRNGDVTNTMYDAFTGKVKGDDDISNNLYDHTKHVVGKGNVVHTGDGTDNNIYDTCTDKVIEVDDINNMYDHTTHTRVNQDENLYDQTSKRNIPSSGNEGLYDQV